MDKKDRLAHLTDRVHDEGTLRIDDIASHYPASPMTLYRDLQELENAGVLRRSRGYVTAVATSITETSMSFRRDQEAQEKEELAPAFESILVRGTSVLLDDSSTALALIGAYTHVDGLTIITNNRAILDLAVSVPAWDAIALGGKLDRHLDAYYGSAGMTMLKGMSADVVILSAAAITDGVVYHPYEEVAAYKALLLESARSRYLAVTPEKFHRTALHAVADTTMFDAVVTTDLDSDLAGSLTERGVNLRLTSREHPTRSG